MPRGPSPLSWWFLGLGALGLLRWGARWARTGDLPLQAVDLAWLLGSLGLVVLAGVLHRRMPR